MRLLCPPCPVSTDCLEYGIATGSVGWWGGQLLRDVPIERKLTAPGALQSFITIALQAATDACIEWPYSRNAQGVPMITDRQNGTKRTLSVRAMVCEAFYGPAPPGHRATYLCGSSLCINGRHLQWSPRGKLTAFQGVEMRRQRAEGMPVIKIAAHHGISVSTVREVVGKVRARPLRLGEPALLRQRIGARAG